MSGGDAGCALDVIIEAINRHSELVGVEGKLPLLVEMLLDKLAQCIDGCARRLERNRLGSPARAPDGQPRDLDCNEREQAAHRDTKAGAGEKPFLMQLHGQFRKAVALRFPERPDWLGRERLQSDGRYAAAVAPRHRT